MSTGSALLYIFGVALLLAAVFFWMIEARWIAALFVVLSMASCGRANANDLSSFIGAAAPGAPMMSAFSRDEVKRSGFALSRRSDA